MLWASFKGCPRLPLEELTQPALIACHQGQCKAGTSLGGTDTQLGSSLEGSHWTLPWSESANLPRFADGLEKPYLWGGPKEKSRLVLNPGNELATRRFLAFPTSNGKSRRGNFEHPWRNERVPHLVETQGGETRPSLQQLAVPGHEA